MMENNDQQQRNGLNFQGDILGLFVSITIRLDVVALIVSTENLELD